MNQKLLILVVAVALFAVADAGEWFHRYGAGNKEDWYFFPAPCAALTAANFPACPTGNPNGHGSPWGSKHQTRFVSYAGCPHAHYGYARRGRWKRFHGVRFNELLKKGARLRRRDAGFLNEATLEGIYCAADPKDGAALVADVLFPVSPIVEKDKSEGQNVKGTVFDIKEQVEEKEGPNPPEADDKNVGKFKAAGFTIPTGACTQAELTALLPLFELTAFNAADKKIHLKPIQDAFVKLTVDPGAAAAPGTPAPARPGTF